MKTLEQIEKSSEGRGMGHFHAELVEDLSQYIGGLEQLFDICKELGYESYVINDITNLTTRIAAIARLERA
jgi:hypothetical protein